MASCFNFKASREKMVEEQLRSRGIRNKRVLNAFKNIPRHRFVAGKLKSKAYRDSPLPIGHKQTISQPYVVALMCQILKLKPKEKVLDIGTGSGYQAAILSKLASDVISLERIKPLAQFAEKRLKKLKIKNVTVLIKNGQKGYSPKAPYDCIISAAAAKQVPTEWKKQLKTNGRIVTPIKTAFGQELVKLTKTKNGFKKESLGQVTFVPLINAKENSH